MLATLRTPATVTHQELKGCQQQQEYMPQFVCKQQQVTQATTVTHATTIAPATRNSRVASDNRTANTARMPANARMLLQSEMTSAAGSTYSIIMDVISNRTARIDSREDSNIQQGHSHQQQQQELTTRTSNNNSRDNRNITDINSRRETVNSKDAKNSRDQPTTVIASAGIPTEQYVRQQLMCFAEIRLRVFRTAKNSQERHKRVKTSHFFQYNFSKSHSYRTIGSPMLLVRQLKSDIPIVVTQSASYRNIGILSEVPICDIPFHHQQYGRGDVFLASSVVVCPAVGVYPLPPPTRCELEGLFISTVKSVDMRGYRLCGRKGVSLSL